MKRILIFAIALIAGTASATDLRAPRNRSSGGKICQQVNVSGTMTDGLCLDASSGLANVGMGTTTPGAGLQISRNGGSDQIKLSRTTTSAGDVFVGSALGDFRVGTTAGGVQLMQLIPTFNSGSPVGSVLQQATTAAVNSGLTNVGQTFFTVNSGSGAAAVTGLLTVPASASGNNPIHMQCNVAQSNWSNGNYWTGTCFWDAFGNTTYTCVAPVCTVIVNSGSTAPTPTSSCASGASFGITSNLTFSVMTMNCTATSANAPLTWKSTINN